MPTTIHLSIEYITPFDPAYVDLWATPVNDAIIALDLDAAMKQINQDFNDKILSRAILSDYAEKCQEISSTSNAATIDLTLGNHAYITLTEDVTLTISNPSPTGNKCVIVLEITQGDSNFAITWPASVKWPGGTPPTLSSTDGAIDEVVLTTRNVGSTWLGTARGQAFA